MTHYLDLIFRFPSIWPWILYNNFIYRLFRKTKLHRLLTLRTPSTKIPDITIVMNKLMTKIILTENIAKHFFVKTFSSKIKEYTFLYYFALHLLVVCGNSIKIVRSLSFVNMMYTIVIAAAICNMASQKYTWESGIKWKLKARGTLPSTCFVFSYWREIKKMAPFYSISKFSRKMSCFLEGGLTDLSEMIYHQNFKPVCSSCL